VKRTATRVVLAAAFAALAAVGGCADGLAFRIDERVSITSPRDEDEVTLPMTLRWDAKDVQDVDSYGVYLDRAPVGPGKRHQDEDGPAFRTTERSLVIRRLDSDRDIHRATIVLLDEEGRRMGESAFEVTFEVRSERTR
jgi:hypothetical protein